MMGHKETTMTVETEEKGGGTLFRRMVLVMAAAAVMAMMMALSAMPAMASAGKHSGNSGDQPPGPPLFTGHPDPGTATVFHDPRGGVCVGHDIGPASTGGSC